MGAFATTVEFYRYREPYPAEFFETVAARLALTRATRLLDVACGPGNLVIGFAPFVGSSTIDREPEMLRAARLAYKIDMDGWFAASRFRRIEDTAVKHRHSVTIPELVGRALSFSTTSPAVVGERRAQFETELRAALEPFARNVVIEEEVIAKARVFG